jgi:hypothetical protein
MARCSVVIRGVAVPVGQVVKGADPWYKWVREELEDVYGNVSFPAFVQMVLDQSKEVGG